MTLTNAADSGTAVDPLKRELMQLVEPFLPSGDHFIIELGVRGHKGSRSVEVVLDSTHGVSVEECAALNRRLVDEPAMEETLGGAFTLQVSSPGASRPLTDPRQYAKHIDRVLAVSVSESDGAEAIVTGQLKAVHPNHISLEADDGLVDIEFSAITGSKVQLPW